MKKVYFLLAGLLPALVSLAQNVGIGTLAPAYRLDLVGRARIQAGTLNNASTSPGIWHTDYRNNTNIAFIGMADSVNYGFWGDRPGVGWEFFFDARYGNVGIGRKPASGTARLSVDHPAGASLNVYANGNYRGGFQATDSTLEIFSALGSIGIPGTPGKNIIFWPPPAPCDGPFCIVSGPSGRIGMYTNEPNARVHIVAGTNTSGVLIGPTSAIPAVGYMLNVDGKIICEELKVQLSGSWPDYVFENNYPLLPLDQLQKQVMDQKHLPGVPSAAEVQAGNGVEMGDMQKRLLEKVEELYRYVFELNAENKALKEELKEVKKKIQ